MNDKELLKAIENLKLAENEAKCYLALFKKDTLTASETAKLSGVPRQNTYKALEKLLVKGLITSIPDGVKRYAATDPSQLKERALIEFKQTVEEELQEVEAKKREIMGRRFRIDSVMDEMINELSSRFEESKSNDNPLEHIEVLRNAEQIHLKHIQLFSESKSQTLALVKPPFSCVSPLLKLEQRKILLEAVKRGVKMKSIHQMPSDKANHNRFLKELNRQYSPKVEEVRLIDKLPLKMVIYDDSAVSIMMEYPNLGRYSLTGLVIENPDFVETQKMMFEAYWNKAMDHYVLDDQKYYLSQSANKKDN